MGSPSRIDLLGHGAPGPVLEVGPGLACLVQAAPAELLSSSIPQFCFLRHGDNGDSAHVWVLLCMDWRRQPSALPGAGSVGCEHTLCCRLCGRLRSGLPLPFTHTGALLIFISSAVSVQEWLLGGP